MKRILEPGAVLRYNGDLVEVVGIDAGRTIIMRPLRRGGMEVTDIRCPTCGSLGDLHVNEDSLNFQTGAEAVPTVVDPHG